MLAPLLAASPLAYATLGITIALFVIALLWVIRPGGVSLLSQLTPQALALRKARTLLQNGDWQSAFAAAGKLRESKKIDEAFERRVKSFEGECLYRAAEEALIGHRYAEALELMRGAGDRLGLPGAEFDTRVVDVLLAEVRRRVVEPTAGDDVAFLVKEVARVAGSCPEASFWLGMRHLIAKKYDAARTALHEALGETKVPDAALYLGALDRRTNRAAEAARWLDHAVRQAPECPVIQWQYGAALLESGGDQARAVKALEFATGSKGLGKHLAEPGKMWVTTLPAHSWVAKVAQRYPFACPLELDRPAEALIEARRQLALALEKSSRPTDAAAAYQQAMTAGDDSLEVLRGLGHNLARAGKHDEARPHLEAAHTREQPPTPLTTGFLAVCTARSETATPQEHAERLAAGIGVLTSQCVRGDADWLKLASDLFAEAQTTGVKISPEQLLELAQVFASCEACDEQAAQVYDQLAGSKASLRRPDGKSAGDALSFIPAEAAWLYVRAAVETGLKYDHDDLLFDRAFRDRDGARKFFTQHLWDFAPAERLFLERWAERREGSYPDAPGPLYPAIAERVLVEESRRLESLGRPDVARAALDLAQRLGPTRALTLDRLAEWAYRRGDRTGTEAFLTSWIENHPNDPRPLVRRGVLARLDGRNAEALKLLSEAGDMANGAAKVKYLIVAARLAVSLGEAERAAEMIEKARSVGAIDAEVLTALAALWWQRGEFEKLAGIAEDLEAVRGDDPFRGLLAGLCHHLSGDEVRAEEALCRAQEDDRFRVEAGLLRAIVLGWGNREEEARAVLAQIEPTDATRDLVNGLRGQFAWKAGDFAQAVADWERLPTPRRDSWKLTSLWPVAAFLAGIKNLTADQPAEALAAFRQAIELGLKDKRLRSLEIRAVQRAIQIGGAGTGAVSAEQFRGLEQTLGANGWTPAASAWLARGYRRQGHPDQARRLLESAGSDHPHVLLQRGLLFLHERQLAAAEGEFAAALEKSPDSPAAVTNLALTRLSLGRLDGLPEMLERAAERTTFGEWRRTLQIFKSLLPGQTADAALTTLTAPEELRLLWRLQRLGRLETSAPMIDRLAAARFDSAAVQQAKGEVQILWTKHLIDRGDWADAAKVDSNIANSGHRALRNLLGVAACLSRQFGPAIKHFQASLPSTGDDARVQQNLALTSAWTGDRTRAAAHWKRCQTHMASHCPAPPGEADYLLRLGRAVRRRLEADEAGTSLPEEVAT